MKTKSQRIKSYITVPICILIAVCAHLWACYGNATYHSITGTFTDLHIHPTERCDLLGTEVHIVDTIDGYQATVQIAEGSPGPLILLPVSFSKEDPEAFSMKATRIQGDEFIFEGRIAQDELIGRIVFSSGGKLDVRLPRRRSFWDEGSWKELK